MPHFDLLLLVILYLFGPDIIWKNLKHNLDFSDFSYTNMASFWELVKKVKSMFITKIEIKNYSRINPDHALFCLKTKSEKETFEK